MPRKAQRRPAKNKTRTRRPVTTQSSAAVAEREEVVSSSQPLTSTRPAPAAPVSSPTRSRSTARKAPTITVDYSYLRRDLTRLAIFAPAMIVLVVVAFIFLH